MNPDARGAVGALADQWPPWAAIRPPLVRNVLGFCAFIIGFICAYHYGMAFSPVVSSPFWFPDAVLLCGLLCTRTRWWWLLLAATLPVRLMLDVVPGTPLWFLGATYLNDCGKAVLSALLLRRWLADPIRFNSLRDFGVYFLIAALLTPMLSALGGAAARSGLGHPFWTSFEHWLLGDAMASIIVTPILFYWLLRPPNPATFRPPRIVEAAVLAIGLLTSLSWAFEPTVGPRDPTETRFYAPVPFMVWAAIRFRMFGATAAAALLSIFAVEAAFSLNGSFANLSPSELASRLQHFLLLRVAPLYLAAVLIEQWYRVSDTLRESERRFRNIADQAPMMMWTSGLNGGCEFANSGWLQFTGRTLEETVGEGWADCLHPDDTQRTFEKYLTHFHSRRPVDLEYRARRHDGEYRWIYVRGMPSYGPNGAFMGFIGSAMDVTERRQQEAALKRSEARYREVVESQTGFVCRFLPDATLTFVNSAFCKFTGMSRLELLGESFIDMLPPLARDAAREAVMRAASSSAHAAWEFEVGNPDGTRGWQTWVCHTIEGAPDDAREIQAVGYDITDRKRAEDSGRQLEHASRFAAVGELTAMVAHEINQPLCAILSNTEAAEIMLQSENPPLAEIREILADIRRDDLRADAAIRGIRALLQRQEFRPRTVDIGEIVSDVMRLVAGDALHRRVRVRREVEGDLADVTADPTQLQQVLVILIVNGMDAMKETPESGRELTIGARRVEGAQVEMWVRDHGHGIAEGNMAQLFDSFFTTKSDGMGLGLAIARSMIAAHGGRIWAANAPDGGAVFRFTIGTAPALPPA